jgi:hypothetical protein
MKVVYIFHSKLAHFVFPPATACVLVCCVLPVYRAEWDKFCLDLQVAREKEIEKMAEVESKLSANSATKGDSFVSPLKLCKILDSVIAQDSIIVADGMFVL